MSDNSFFESRQSIYIIILYPDDDRRPCIAMAPWVTPHSTGLATNSVLRMFLKLSMLSPPGGGGGGGVLEEGGGQQAFCLVAK